ncbi:carboxymuconolactone decarboxylase family protein [Actinomadura sp. KC345]|uniref:carboxymuconolactone decarboxylase family protein n=1 Tax=Actinomadura sp. KC345 TaxID=2530371 RepID=UPI00104B060B|nr:carboxymuconolactone decarboxylase family protein [Actinomadura sp. KC345]TDC46672.1 carboxymuconolactone decarboxylase family protein [Actinomadura sp. KC345]
MSAFRIDLHAAAPDVHAAMAGLDRAASADLDPLLAELVRVRVSRINGCAFCLSAHTRAAVEAGEDERRLDALASWRESPRFTGAERAALGLAEAMTSIGPAGVPDAVFAAAREHFDETALAHLLWTIAAINAWNRVSIAAFP